MKRNHTPKIQRLGRAVSLSILYPCFRESDFLEALIAIGLRGIASNENRGVFHIIYIDSLNLLKAVTQSGPKREVGRKG